MRTSLAALMVAAVVFLLAACGARIDTVLIVNDDGSGVRAITATVSQQDLRDYVTGGAEAIEAVIAANAPAEMTYEGRTVGDDDAAVFTFSISFADEAEYENKVIAILGAGGVVDRDADVEVTVADSVFRQGVRVSENYSSRHLLRWLTNALVDSGAVASDQRQNTSELGQTVIEFADVRHETSGEIEYEDMRDFGIRALTVSTTGLTTGQLVRTISYDLAREAYASNPEGFDAFFADAVPEGAEFVPAADAETIWTLTFNASSPEDLAAATNQALGSKNAQFALTNGVAVDDPTTIRTSVVDYVDCSAICSTEATVNLQARLPAGWSSAVAWPTGPDTDGMAAWDLPNSTEPVDFTHKVPFQSVDAVTRVSPKGSTQLDLTFVIDPAHAELVGEALTEELRPTSTLGELEVHEIDDGTAYRVTIEGSTPEVFDGKLRQYLPDSYLRVAPVSTGLFTEEYAVYQLLAFPEGLINGGVVDGLQQELHLPGGHEISDQSRLPGGTEVAGNTVAFSTPAPGAGEVMVQATGLRTATLLLAGGTAAIVVAVIAGVVLLTLRSRSRAQTGGQWLP